MINKSSFAIALFALATIALIGCSGKGYSVAPVSGKVTADGKPVVGIRVAFTPRPQEGSAAGPWSSGITNEQGEYTLVTRYEENGAVVGMNDVSFAYDDVDAETFEELYDELEEAQSEDDKESFDEVKKRLERAKAKLKDRISVSEDLSLEFEVPAGGTQEANFDVPEVETPYAK